jgi:hypothetical protein
MTRRAVKKALRRAEEALQAQRYLEAHSIYAGLLMMLEGSQTSLLDHAACIYGLVRTLHALEETQAAIDLADSAVERLAANQPLPVAA